MLINQQWDKSFQTYEKVVKKNVDLAPEEKLNFAKVCLNNQYFEKAESLCDELLDDNFADAHSVLASISKETKNYPKMVEHLKKAIDISPEKLIHWHELSSYYIDSDDYEAAEPVISSALSNFPDDSVLLYFKGLIFYSIKSYDDAIDTFRAALEYFDGQSILKITKEDILKKLVRAYYKTGQYETISWCL